MTSTRRDPLVGDIVDGRYEVRERVARGGMSTVYRALDLRLDREVALKVMHPHLAEDPALVGRFEREAKTAARLSHPHLVAVLDQGHTAIEGGEVLAYLVMEYVPGHTLRGVVRDEAPVTPRRVLGLMRPVTDGLAAAHRAGLVHRDVKPENVLLRDDGRVTVADFGLSRAATGHTSVGQALLGTPAYLAPELITGGEADARADVYAVGIMLFELLTGRQPFTAAQPIQVAYRHVHERVPVPSTLVPGLAESLDDLVLWCTEPDPADRPADAGVLLAELDRVAASLSPAELDHVPVSVSEDADLQATRAMDASPASTGASTVAFPERIVPDDDATRVLGVGAASRPAGAHALTADDIAASAPRPDAPGAGSRPGPPTPQDGAVDADRAPTRRQARRPLVDVGAGATRTVAIGAAVTLLLTGVALLLGWTLGTGGLGTGQAGVMPSLAGLGQDDARARLADAGVSVAVTARHDERYSDGTVVATTPEAGAEIARGAAVELTVSDGPAPVPVPDLEGLGVNDAHARADDGRLAVEVAERRSAASVPAGRVLSQSPGAGEHAAPGSTVQVVLSSGPARHAVPELEGLSVDDARHRLEELGLGVETEDVRRVLRFGAPSTVVEQGTPAGTELPEGSVVRLRAR